MSLIEIASNIRNYVVRFNRRDDFLDFHECLESLACIIDENVWNAYGKTVLRSLPSDRIIVVRVCEEKKTLDVVGDLYDKLIERSAKRNLTMLSIGGGILQDLSGFTASTLYRGINWIFVPTTLLAQADSCIGSKTSLNYKRFKNLIGTFYPPSEIHIHTPFLKTLPDLDFLSGLGEVVKLHMMGGEIKSREFDRLLPSIMKRDLDALEQCVSSSLLIKKSYMEGDEFDTGRRNLLNFGHTLGHALEASSNYQIPHGQAVVLGVIFSNIAARNRGLLSSMTFDRHLNTLLRSLAVNARAEDFDEKNVLEAMGKDKKRIGTDFSLVMLKDDYTMIKVNDCKQDEISRALEELKAIALGDDRIRPGRDL